MQLFEKDYPHSREKSPAMNSLHRELAQGRWNTCTLPEQLAHTGSEVECTVKWYNQGNKDFMIRAAERALDLFSLTLACPNNRDRLRKICRAKQLFLDVIFGDNEYRSSEESVKRYFYQFALLVYRQKEPLDKEKQLNPNNT